MDDSSDATQPVVLEDTRQPYNHGDVTQLSNNADATQLGKSADATQLNNNADEAQLENNADATQLDTTVDNTVHATQLVAHSERPPNPQHHVCTRLQSGNRHQMWRVVGLITDGTNVHPKLFTFALELRACDKLAGREVFARTVPRLVNRGYFRSRLASQETLRYLEVRPWASADEQGLAEPSWAGIVAGEEMTFASCQLVLA